MIARQLFRSFHANHALYSTSTKTMLGELRKRTGYSFVNCKTALTMHENDLGKAEQWLKEQAQKQGWAQQEKLQHRVTTQGLLALISNNSQSAVVEINCETDFVARNELFHQLAETVATTVFKNGMSVKEDNLINRTMFDTETIESLVTEDGKTLRDCTALTISNIRENIKIRRGLYLSVQPGVKLFGCTHPTPINPVPTSFGKYAALVALKSESEIDIIGQQLCQHVIGMNPSKIGDPHIDEPNQDLEEESIMIYQDFLLDPSVSVQQLLENENAELLDFARFEVGEELEKPEILNTLETGC